MNCPNKLPIAAAIVLIPAVTCAHHGLGGRYDQDSTLELEGEVTRILWRNPHIRLSLSVSGENGEAAAWAVEGTAPTIIQRYGITEGMANEGDRIRVAGFPSSRGLNEISIHNLLLPSGEELLLDPRFQARWSDDTIGEGGTFLRIRDGDTILMRIEEYDLVRTIHMDGNPPDGARSLLGQSVGAWDGPALVVTTTQVDWPHFNQMGVFLTPDAEIVERFTPSEDGSRLDYQLIVTDPAVFIEPPVIEKFWLWDPELRVEEFNCTESYQPVKARE